MVKEVVEPTLEEGQSEEKLQESVMVFVIVPRFLGSSFVWSLHEAKGHDPDWRGRGFQPVWTASVLRPSPWLPSHSG
jgi:hypothetical protein